MARKSLLHRQQVIDYWREIGFEPVCDGGVLLDGRAARDSAEAYALITRHLFEEVVEYAKSVCELTLED